MSEVEQRREQLPSERVRQATGAAHRGDGAGEDAVRFAKARRNAWLLGGFAVLFYLGYMAWLLLRASGS
jgi:hypothetical protein